MATAKKITNEADYKSVMARIDKLMSKGSGNASKGDLAKKLKICNTKLSLIMNGKQKPDVDFLKAVHKQLQVNGDFLLNSL